MKLVIIRQNLNIIGILQSVKSSITNDVIFTLINSFWRIISGPITLIFIPLFISPKTQGFWYTFISLAALSIFADLGFTTIVSQFSAHEYAFLRFNKQKILLEGDEEKIKRIGSLFRFIIKWALSVSAIGFPLILLVGFFMFWRKGDGINWFLPWILYIISSGISFTTNAVLSFLEGCNQIAEIQKNKIISAISISVSMWTFLYSGFNLFALAFTAFIGILLNVSLLFYRFKPLLLQLFRQGKDYYINWKKDFLKLIWRYAISWSSGYFIFQIYTPLTFQFHGAVAAGKVGISMALATAIFSIANVWIYVSTPKLNMYASRKEWQSMDKILWKSTLLSLGTFLLEMAVVLAALNFYSDKLNFLKRFLGIIPMSILLTAWVIQLVINALAAYLRAHKQEPLVWISLTVALYIVITTFIVSKFLSPDFLFLGFLSAVFWGLPITFYIFVRKKNAWHS